MLGTKREEQPAEQDRHSESEKEARADDKHGVGSDEGFVGVEERDWIDRRGGEHVNNGAGDRQAFTDESSHDRDGGAFADGDDETQNAAEKHCEEFVLREHALDGAAWEVNIDEPGKHGAEQNEGHSLEQNAEEGECEIAFKGGVHQ